MHQRNGHVVATRPVHGNLLLRFVACVAQAVAVLKKLAKQRLESVSMYAAAKSAAGNERAAAEQAELDIITKWLPAVAGKGGRGTHEPSSNVLGGEHMGTLPCARHPCAGRMFTCPVCGVRRRGHHECLGGRGRGAGRSSRGRRSRGDREGDRKW